MLDVAQSKPLLPLLFVMLLASSAFVVPASNEPTEQTIASGVVAFNNTLSKDLIIPFAASVSGLWAAIIAAPASAAASYYDVCIYADGSGSVSYSAPFYGGGSYSGTVPANDITCLPEVTAGGTLQMTASPSSGYSFTGWTGAFTSSSNPISVTVNSNLEAPDVTANFGASTATQPLAATFNSVNGGSQQTITVNGCSPSPSTFAGDGATHDISMTPSCSFSLSLPSGYQFTGGTGTTTCSSGACSTYSTSYEATAPPTVTQPITATFNSANGGSQQTITISGCGASPSSFAGDGTSHSIGMTRSCSFTLSLPSGYQFTGGAGSTTCASGTCSTYSTSYERTPTTVTQPVEASLTGSGTTQYVTASGCGIGSSQFYGDGSPGMADFTMSPSCTFTLTLSSGYVWVSTGSTTVTDTTCSTAGSTCQTFSPTYEQSVTTVTQPVEASLTGSGTSQYVTASGCGIGSSQFYGDGSSGLADFTMSPSCTFTLTLPSGYVWVSTSTTSITGTTCSTVGSTCSTFSATYEESATTVTQPVQASLSGAGATQYVTASGCGIGSTQFYGDGSVNDIYPTPSCTFTLTLSSGYVWVSTGTATITGNSCSPAGSTCSTFSADYEQSITTVTQPVEASLTGSGASQYITASGCGVNSQFYGDGSSGLADFTMTPSCTFTLTLPSGYVWVSTGTTTITDSTCPTAGSTCSTFSPTYEQATPSTVTQPVEASLSGSGSSQYVTASGCGIGSSQFYGDGSSGMADFTMTPSCTFTLTLPSGYVWVSTESATITDITCSTAGTKCSTFSASYEQALTTVTQPIAATFNSVNGGSQQTVTITGCNASPSTFLGDGASHSITMSPSCAFTLSLPSGYQFTGGLGTTTCSPTGTTCTAYSTTYEATAPTTITQPITASFNNVNGGTQQSIAITGCNPSPSSFSGDGTSHSITMSPSCTFTLSLPSGYQFVGGSSSITCSSGICNAYSTSYEAVATTVTQPITATFNNVNGGSQQAISISGCSPSPPSFAGDGSSHSIMMNPSCAFTLSLPSGYQFTGGSGTTSCSSGACSTYTTTYEAAPAATGTLSIILTGFPSSQSAEVSITGPNGYSVLPSISGGGTDTLTNLAPGTYTVQPGLTAGYQPTQGTYTETVTAGQTTNVTIPYVPITVTQPVIATFNSVNGGSQQTITISGCSASPSTFAGDGTTHGISMAPSCNFSLSLPAGYQFAGGTGTSTCTSGTCSTYSTTYEAVATSVTQPMIATFSNVNGGSAQTVTVSGCNAIPATFSGDGTTQDVTMNPNCAFTLSLPAGYQFTGGTGATSCSSGKCSTYTTNYEAISSTVIQPVAATLNDVNGGFQQTITISGCSASPSTFAGDGASHAITMTPSCAFTLTLNAGYVWVSTSSATIIDTACSTAGSTCSTSSHTYEQAPPVVSTITLSPNPCFVTQTTGTTGCPLTITVVDQYGNPMSGVTLAMTATGSDNPYFSPNSLPSTGSNGQTQSTVYLSASVSSPETITVTAFAGVKSGSDQVTFNPAPSLQVVYYHVYTTYLANVPTSCTPSTQPTDSTSCYTLQSVTPKEVYAGLRFSVVVGMMYTGANNIPIPSLQTSSTGKDANGNGFAQDVCGPGTRIDPSTESAAPLSTPTIDQTIPPNEQVSILYTCEVPIWGYYPSGVDFTTVVQNAIVTAGVKVAQEAIPEVALVGYVGDVYKVLVTEGEVVPTASYALSLSSSSGVEIQGQSGALLVSAPQFKIDSNKLFIATMILEPVVNVVSVAAVSVLCPECDIAPPIQGALIGAEVSITSSVETYLEMQMSDPSSNYTEFVSPPVAPESLMPNGNVTSELLYNIYMFNGYMNASSLSDARAIGALMDNNSYYAYLQEVRATSFAQNASVHYTAMIGLTKQLLNQLSANGTLNYNSFKQGQETLESQGFSPQVMQILKELGLAAEAKAAAFSNSNYVPANSTAIAALSYIPNAGNFSMAVDRMNTEFISSSNVYGILLGVQGIPAGISVLVEADNVTYSYPNLPSQLSWNLGTVHSLSCTKSLPNGLFQTFAFLYWTINNETVTNCDLNITVSGSISIMAVYGITINTTNAVVAGVVVTAVAAMVLLVIRRRFRNHEQG